MSRKTFLPLDLEIKKTEEELNNTLKKLTERIGIQEAAYQKEKAEKHKKATFSGATSIVKLVNQ